LFLERVICQYSTANCRK